MIEIQLKDPKKFLTNWPPLDDQEIPEQMRKKAQESKEQTKEFFVSMKKQVNKRIDELEVQINRYLEGSMSDFEATYSLLAQKAKLKEYAVDRMNIPELKKLIAKVNRNKESNTELLKSFLSSLEYSSQLEPIKEISSSILK